LDAEIVEYNGGINKIYRLDQINENGSPLDKIRKTVQWKQ